MEPEYRIVPEIFTREDGLPPSGINGLLQTRDGYLWLGTFGGLARFDGQKFIVFRAHSDAKHRGAHQEQGGPASDRIIALYEDAEGRLWIGTEDAGLGVYANGVFRQLPICGGTCQVNAVLQSQDGAIWVASNSGVLKFNPETGREAWIRRTEAEGFTRLASDGLGQVYVGGYDGLYAVVDETLKHIRLPGDAAWVKLLKPDGDGLLVGTEHALYQYTPNGERWRSLGVGQPTYASRDAEGLWWVLQADGTVLREDAGEGWKTVSELSGVGVMSLARDDEGNFWAGTGGRGLFRIRKPMFGLMSSPQLGTDMAGRAVISDGDGGLWLGSACGGLRHWTQDGRMQTVPISDALGTECVVSLLLDRAGVLWIGGVSGSLARMQGSTPERVATWGSKESVNVWQLQGGQYVAGVGGVTYVIEPDADGRVSTRRRIAALQGMRISSVVPATRGGHWFVGDQGVFRVIDESIVERWTPKEGLSSRFARALYDDGETGDIWVATYNGGLNRIVNGLVHRYDSHNGLFDDAVSCILKDVSGRLWLGGNRGVTVLRPAKRPESTIASVGYASHDGLVPAEINGGNSSPCHRDGLGRFWFSLVEGFGVVDPKDLPDKVPVPPRPHIEQVIVDGRVLGAPSSTITLPSFTRNLDIRYSAISLARPQETRFRFRLSGVDRDWVEAGKSRNVLYSSIPWGRHLLEVQAGIVGGDWSPVAAKLQIIHPQPWYLRPWVWSLATLLGLLVLMGSSRLQAVNGER